MANQHALRVYDYVNHPYASVREALLLDPRAIFEKATTTAAARAHALGAELHVKIGSIQLAADVVIEIGSIDEMQSPLGQPGTRLELAWKSRSRSGWFPTMKATLLVYALTSTETQLELVGTYEPPMGVVGATIDSLFLHHVAEASVLHFVQEIAAFLRAELPART